MIHFLGPAIFGFSCRPADDGVSGQNAANMECLLVGASGRESRRMIDEKHMRDLVEAARNATKPVDPVRIAAEEAAILETELRSMIVRLWNTDAAAIAAADGTRVS